MKHRLPWYALALFLVGCVRPATEQDLYLAQSLVDIQDALSDLRTMTWELHDQVDSLRTVVAQRDSIISRLAAQAGLALQP